MTVVECHCNVLTFAREIIAVADAVPIVEFSSDGPPIGCMWLICFQEIHSKIVIAWLSIILRYFLHRFAICSKFEWKVYGEWWGHLNWLGSTSEHNIQYYSFEMQMDANDDAFSIGSRLMLLRKMRSHSPANEIHTRISDAASKANVFIQA